MPIAAIATSAIDMGALRPCGAALKNEAAARAGIASARRATSARPLRSVRATAAGPGVSAPGGAADVSRTVHAAADEPPTSSAENMARSERTADAHMAKAQTNR